MCNEHLLGEADLPHKGTTLHHVQVYSNRITTICTGTACIEECYLASHVSSASSGQRCISSVGQEGNYKKDKKYIYGGL